MKLTKKASIISDEYLTLAYLGVQKKRLSSKCFHAEQLGSDDAFWRAFIVGDALKKPENEASNNETAYFIKHQDSAQSMALSTQPENISPNGFKLDFFNVDGNSTCPTFPEISMQKVSLEKWLNNMEQMSEGLARLRRDT